MVYSETRIRVMKLGKRNIDVIEELRRRGYKVALAEFSRFSTGVDTTTAKAQRIREATDEILAEWETGAVPLNKANQSYSESPGQALFV